MNLARRYVQVLEAVATRDTEARPALAAVVPAAPLGQSCVLVSEDGLIARGQRLDVLGLRGVTEGDEALVYDAGAIVLVQLRADALLPLAAAGAAVPEV